jgi:hypothetical protein
MRSDGLHTGNVKQKNMLCDVTWPLALRISGLATLHFFSSLSLYPIIQQNSSIYRKLLTKKTARPTYAISVSDHLLLCKYVLCWVYN